MENKEIIEVIESMKTKAIPIYDPLTDQITYVSEETYKKILETAHYMAKRIKNMK